MILWRKASLAVLVIVVIHLLMFTAYAATIDVGPGAKFSNIQDAVDKGDSYFIMELVTRMKAAAGS